MALPGDLPACVASIQADTAIDYTVTATGSGWDIPADTGIIIKVTQYEIDVEHYQTRLITSGRKLPNDSSNPINPWNTGVSCVPVTTIDYSSSKLRGMGFIDPSEIVSQFILWSTVLYSYAMNLKNVTMYLDDGIEYPGSRTGYKFGSPDSYTPTNNWGAKLIPLRLTGRTDADGMQEIEFELHAMSGFITPYADL